MKKAIFAVLLLLATTGRAGAQVDSSCLVMWQDSPLFIGSGYAWFNPDSVKVDVCQGPQYLQEFAKHYFSVYFLYYIIPIPDSVALNGADTAIHTWQDIDTAFTALRDSFQSVEQKFGTFTLEHSDDGPGDTSLDEKAWIINFHSYLNIDTVDTALSNLPDINPALGWVGNPAPSFYESVNLKTSEAQIRVWPEPCNSEVNISGIGTNPDAKFFDPLGREVTLPLALSENVLTVDVSSQPNGVIYCSDDGHVFKILIQH
jgi:hypothetical protein